MLSANKPATAASSEQLPFEREIAQRLVEALGLQIAAEDIAPLLPLHSGGLGFDSIDILEIAMEVSRHYGLPLRADDARNEEIFSTLRSLASYVEQNRSRVDHLST